MRLFISYHSRDKVLANKLVETLRNQLGPHDEIFYDAQSLRGGSCWPGILANKIMEADAFVLLIADNGVGSWQMLEYYEAFDQWVKTRKPMLVPVLREGQSAPGLPFLKHLHWIIEPDPASERCVGRIIDAIHTPRDGALTNPWRYTRPYRGLLAMNEADSDFFFGRGSETERVLQILQSPAGRLPILVGNSGVGKTSIAQAGVLAAMKRQAWPKASSETAWPSVFQDSRRWVVLTIRPGKFPLQALVHAFWSLWRFSEVDPNRETLQRGWIQRLHEGTASLKGLLDATQERLTNCGEDAPSAFLLYLDQGEELYTRADQEQARRFSSILADGVADPRLRAFASIRSDFYGQLQADQALCSVWERVDVHPLDREAIIDVITMPAKNLGASFLEPSLPGELARQTVEHTGYLPLLSYLLDDMWNSMQKRGDGLLLPSIGTVNVGGVLAAAGDRFIHEHPDEMSALKRIFTLKLVHMEEHGDPMRRRAVRSEFTDEEWELVTKLADHPWRLLVTGQMESQGADPFAEVGHEALLREWGQLRDWLTGEQGQRNFFIWKTALERVRLRYDSLDGTAKKNALLHGYDLQQARAWKELRATDIPAADLTYINASIQADDEQKLWVLQQLRDSRATQSRFLADLSSQRLKEGKVGEALAFALEATPLHVPDWPLVIEAENALFAAVHAHSTALVKPIVSFVGHKGTVQGAAYTADASRVLTWSYDGTARVWDAASGDALHVLRHDRHLMGATFSEDGEKVLSWSGDGTARLWSAISGEQLASFRHEDEVRGARLYSKESLLLTWSTDGTARLWDAVTGRELATLRHESRVSGAVLTKDEMRVLTWSFDGSARLWGSSDGRQLISFCHEQMIRGARFSSDESAVLTFSVDGTACVWDTSSGDQRTVMRHDREILGAAFSKDESRVLSWSADSTARVWDVFSGQELARMQHESDYMVGGALFSKDESRVLTWSSDKTARMWDIPSGEQLVRMEHANLVTGAAFSKDESTVLTWSLDGTARLWSGDGKTSRKLTYRHDAAVRGASFGGDGSWVWTWSDDYTAKLWVAASGKESAVLRHDGEVFGLASSPQGDTMLTWAADGSARVWDISGKGRVDLLRHDASILGARISKDSKTVLSWSADGAVTVWDANDGQVLARGRYGESMSGAVLSPRESILTTWSDDGAIRLWDAAKVELRGECQHSGRVLSAVLSMDESMLLTCSVDNTAKLWEAETGKELLSLPHEQEVGGVALSRDGARAVTWSDNGTVFVWDSNIGNLICSVKHDGAVHGAIFSERDRRLLTWSDDGTARMWHIISGAEILSMRHKNAVTGAVFSREEAQLLTFSRDGTARIWDAESSKQSVLLKHDDSVAGAIFSSDEAQVLSWSDDGTARLWDIRTGRERVRLRHDSNVSSASFTPDGRRVITWSDGVARLWDAARGGKLASFVHGSGSGEAQLAEDRSRLLTWMPGDLSVALWPITWSPEDLVNRTTAITKRLRPLSKVDRCQAYLDSEGCYELGGASERDLAIEGNLLFPKEVPSGVGNLTDFAIGVSSDAHLDIEVAVSAAGKVVLFHNRLLPNLSRFRFYRMTNSFEFVRKDGEVRNAGLPLTRDVAIYLETADYALMVFVDPKTGESKQGDWLPLDVY